MRAEGVAARRGAASTFGAVGPASLGGGAAPWPTPGTCVGDELAPYWQDAHPDHVAASSLCDDARFWSKLSRSDMAGEPFWPPLLLHYFSIHLRIHPTPSIVMDISAQIETKMAAVKAFESQMITGRKQEFPTVVDDIRDRARYWGWSIGKAFGEPLVNRESTGIASLSSLLR